MLMTLNRSGQTFSKKIVYLSLFTFLIAGQVMAATESLAELDVGEYAELAKRPNPKHLVLQYVPALAALLARAEQLKAAPLTQAEVEKIRDHASVMVANNRAAKAVAEKRGYKDIHPESAWEEWKVLRTQLPR
ncbi:hypothetical protein [Variovorax paradoxus]|uniref:hypothetical protein n=1 Tax=Variovorax paradoxus TaxID=34073 RepID=UPI001D177C0C|nr:hypothetical protein [Variovorax paradoxus]